MLELLMVDDDDMVRESLAMLLRREGFAVSTASSGTEAIEAATRQVFDIIVTDVRMPGADGIEVVRRVQDLQPGTHFVIVTGFASEEVTVQALRLKVDDWFHKPFDLAAFVERLRAIGRARTRAGSDPMAVLRRFVHLVGEVWPTWGRHVEGLAARCMEAARAAGLAGDARQALQLAALLHDLRNVEGGLETARAVDDDGTPLEQVVALIAGAAAESDAGRILEAELEALRAGVEAHHPPVAAAPTTPVEAAPLVIHSLGPARCVVEGREVQRADWESASARALFHLLLCERGRRVSEDRIFEALWPRCDAERARRSLKTSVYRVRKALCNPAFVVSSERYLHLDLGVPHWWDAEEMEAAARRAAAHESAHDLPAALREWKRAAGLYAGAFLEGQEADWLQATRDSLHQLAVRAQTRVAALHAALGDEAAAEVSARAALELDATGEEAQVVLVRALAAQGRRDEAVRAYHAAVEALARHLSLGPGPDLLRAYLEITEG